jgi:hypothetical protein
VSEEHIASLLSGKFKEAYVNLPAALRELDEQELLEVCDPTPKEWAYRKRFSTKIREAQELQLTEITAASVHEGVTSSPYFFQYILPQPKKVAFITRPLLDHNQMYEALHELAMAKIYEIVRKHPLEPKYLPQLTKVAEMSANRAHGAVIQRQQIVQKNINGGREGEPQKQVEGSIQDQIDALQKQLLIAQRDVTPPKDAE